MVRWFRLVLGIMFIAVAISGLVLFRIQEVQSGKLLSVDSLLWWFAVLVIAFGVYLCMQAAYEREWAGWRPLKQLRAVALGGALVFFSLSIADILIVWTAGFSYNQGLIGANTTLIEGISFREWVTELGLGAFLVVLGLILDLAEKDTQSTAEGYFD